MHAQLHIPDAVHSQLHTVKRLLDLLDGFSCSVKCYCCAQYFIRWLFSLPPGKLVDDAEDNKATTGRHGVALSYRVAFHFESSCGALYIDC